MRDSLLRELQGCLEPEDLFVFLPVFYAGGSTSFKPSSQEIATEYAAAGLNCLCLDDRQNTKDFLDSRSHDFQCLLVVGARDPSLPDWATSLTEADS